MERLLRPVALLTAVGAVGFPLPEDARASIAGVGGSAFGEQVVLTSGVGVSVTSGPAPAVSLGSSGGGPFTDSLASAAVGSFSPLD